MSEFERLLRDPLVFRLGLALAHFLWQGAALALLALLVLAFLRRARPAARYLGLLALFGGMAAAPIVTFALATQPPRPAVMTRTEMGRLLMQAAEQRSRSPAAPAGESPYAAPSFARAPRQPLLSRLWERLRQAWRSAQPRLPAAAVGWMLGVLALSLRLLARWRLLVRSRRCGLPLQEARWQQALASLSQRLGVKRAVQVFQSALVAVPTVFGWLRPVILLPPAAVLGLTPDQLEAVLAHELAHVRRLDFLVNLFQTAVETLLFYHPAVWWLSRRIRVEREHCCDDLAAACCGDTLSYARGLAALEVLRAHPPEPALAASGGRLLLRLQRLAGIHSAPTRRGLVSWLSAALPLLALALVVATPSLASRGGAPYIRGTLMYAESDTRTWGAYREIYGDVARAISGRSKWMAKAPSPLYLAQYSPNGDEVLIPYDPATVWNRKEEVIPTGGARYCTAGKRPLAMSHIWKAKVDSSGWPDLSRAVDLIDVAGIGGDNSLPRWSPDGRRFLFFHTAGCIGVDGISHEWELWIMNADGTGAHQVVIPGRTYKGGAQWTPAGSGLLLNAVRRRSDGVPCDSGCSTFLLDVSSGHTQELPLRFGVISPDEQWVIGFRDYPHHGIIPVVNTGKGRHHLSTGDYRWELVLVRPDGTGERTLLSKSYPLADLPDRDPCITAVALTPHDLAWSPDGRQFAFVSAMNWDRKGPPINKQVELFIYDLPTGRLIQVTHDDLEQCTPVWTE